MSILKTLLASQAYILHCGANQTERGLPHPQQLLLDMIDDSIKELESKATKRRPENIVWMVPSKLAPTDPNPEMARIEKRIAERASKIKDANCVGLDDGVPNHFDRNKRFFQPK